jgi:cupin 2 domain-containing protein
MDRASGAGTGAAGNLFANVPSAAPAEVLETLLVSGPIRIERIVSTGQATPPGEWYDQTQAEWVVLLRGAAGLRFEDEPAARVLGPGDWLHIAARRRHRVEWTDSGEPTIWLAVHVNDAAAGGEGRR